MKLAEGYDKTVIEDYNNFVQGKIKYISEQLQIDIDKYKPKDVDGIEHMLGLFDLDAHYEVFKTLRCKKVCLL